MDPDLVGYTGPPSGYVRIYQGTGVGQVARVVSIVGTVITIERVWNLEQAEDLEAALDDPFLAEGQLGWLTVPDDSSQYVLVPCSKMWVRYPYEFPALVAAGEVRSDGDLWTRNDAAQGRIDDARIELQAAVGGEAQFIEIPAIYLGAPAPTPAGWRCFAYVPGMVNMQVWADTLLIPIPYGPRGFLTSDNFGLFTQTVLLTPDRFPAFLDDWDWYHRALGEVHCGTNVIRTPSETYQRWWEAAAP